MKTWGIIFAVLSVASVASTARAEASDPLLWLLGEIESAWGAGQGRAHAAISEGDRRAVGREGRALEALIIEVAPEVSRVEVLRSEVAGAVGVDLRVLGTGFRERGARARVDLSEAEALATRMAFAEAVIERYGDWVVATLRVEDILAHLTAYETGLAPLRELVERQQLHALAVDSLEVERLKLGTELEAARTELAEAASALSVALGRPFDSSARGVVTREAVAAVWRELGATAHPELERLDREAEVHLAQAEVERRADDPVLSLMATLRRVDDSGAAEVYGGVSAGLTLPLSRAGEAEAERLRGRATALRFERQSRAAVLALEVEQRAVRHERWQGELARLKAEVAPRLEARVKRVEAAMRLGRAGVVELVMAQRDWYEARHAETVLVGRLVASALMSRFWQGAFSRGAKGAE